MTNLAKLAVLAATFIAGGAGIARADCEADLLQLEQAYKTPNLSASSRAALDVAKPVAVAAMKKDDDGLCHTAVMDGMAKAGLAAK